MWNKKGGFFSNEEFVNGPLSKEVEEWVGMEIG